MQSGSEAWVEALTYFISLSKKPIIWSDSNLLWTQCNYNFKYLQTLQNLTTLQLQFKCFHEFLGQHLVTQQCSPVKTHHSDVCMSYLIKSVGEPEVSLPGQLKTGCHQLLSKRWREGGEGETHYWQKGWGISFGKPGWETKSNVQDCEKVENLICDVHTAKNSFHC